jgi:DNA-directed RNA polymerase specialized sigma24 family protein
MSKNSTLDQNEFDELLNWLSPNREEAGEKYESIRAGLIRFFSFKGCGNAEDLTDETINRVARKLSKLDLTTGFQPISFFYGFASKIYLEYRKKVQQSQVEFKPNIHSDLKKTGQTEKIIEDRHQCLDKCLEQVSPQDKNLAIQYFSKEKSAKFEHRRNLAAEMGLSINTMQVRIYRLKSVLRDCVENCLKEK